MPPAPRPPHPPSADRAAHRAGGGDAAGVALAVCAGTAHPGTADVGTADPGAAAAVAAEWDCATGLALVVASAGAAPMLASSDGAAGDRAAAAAPAAPAWVQLFPAGPEVVGADGRRWTLRDAARVVAQSRALAATTQGLLPIDYDHSTERAVVGKDGAPPQGEAPAAGWIVALEARADGVWGRVEWTPRGARAVADREYRFLSPTFFHAKNGEIQALARAALTNVPNLALRALAARAATRADDGGAAGALAAASSSPERPTAPMSLLQRLIPLLGLAADTTDDALVARCTALREREATAAATLAALAGALEVAVPADGALPAREPLLTALTSRVEAARAAGATAGAPDPTQYVPIAMYQALAARAGEVTTQARTDAVARAVDAAITSGRVPPAQREWATSYASRDLAGFERFVEAQPAIFGGAPGQPGQSATPGAPATPAARAPGQGAPGGGALTDEDRAICTQLGLKEADYVKELAAAVRTA